MREFFIRTAKQILSKYRLYDRTRAFKKRYQNVDPSLFKNTVDESVLNKYKNKWSIVNKKVEINTFLLSYNLSGVLDYNIVPENFFAAIIEPKLNPYKELSFFAVKNIYEQWFSNPNIFPKSIFHKLDNIYYSRSFQKIDDIEKFIFEEDFIFPVMLKPSKDTYGGTGVLKIENKEDLNKHINNYDHLVCQEMIIQNEYLNLINDSSINSIRSCLYRDIHGNFHILNNSIRFGINGGLDNETAGGIVCNIHENGQLNKYALDKYANKYIQHPNSRVEFSSIQIPLYTQLNEVCIEIATQIPLCNLLSLDMCLDENNKWRCLEINIIGQTIRFSQYAGKGFFGPFTEEIINRITEI